VPADALPAPDHQLGLPLDPSAAPAPPAPAAAQPAQPVAEPEVRRSDIDSLSRRLDALLTQPREAPAAPPPGVSLPPQAPDPVLDPAGHSKWVEDRIEAVASRERRAVEEQQSSQRFWSQWQNENQDIAPVAGELATRTLDAIIYENQGRRPTDEAALRRQITERVRNHPLIKNYKPGEQPPAAIRTGGTGGPSGAPKPAATPAPEAPVETYATTLWKDRERVTGLNGGKYW